MEISTIRNFVEITRAGSLRRAAERANITPSALSRQIAVLERVLGVRLFERNIRGMVLTPEGEVFQKRATRTLREFELARSEIDDLRGLRRGSVKIVALEGAVTNFLFSLAATFRSAHPGVTFEISAAGNDQVIEAIESDNCDIGIGFNSEDASDIEIVAQERREIVAIVSPGHSLAGRPSLGLQELQGLEMGVLDRSFGTRQSLDRALTAAGLELNFALTLNSVEMAKAFARNGFGLTILPAFAARRECEAGELIAIPIFDPMLQNSEVTICVRRNRELTRAASAFLELMISQSDSI